MKKNVWISGLIAGAIVSATLIISTTLCYNKDDYSGNMVLGFGSMIVAFSFIFVGVRNYRNNYNQGTISFLNALGIGMLISLIASTIYVAVWLVDFYFFIPDFMDKYTAHVLQQAKASGATPEALREQVADITLMQKRYENPAWVIFYTYMEIFPLGLLVALISALILKRSKPKTASH